MDVKLASSSSSSFPGKTSSSYPVNYHKCALRHIRSHNIAKMLAHSIVSSQLDYANALLHNASDRNLDRLQVAQNSLARVVCQAPRSANATKL